MVVADNYKNMLFEEGDSVGSVFSGEESCKVLVKTSDSIRSIDLFLAEGEDSEFHYQITKIRENELYEKESFWGKFRQAQTGESRETCK